MTRLKALLKKADKAAVIGMTAAAVAMAALGAGYNRRRALWIPCG